MELMIDIGNTHTVIGVFRENVLEHNWRMMSHMTRTEDERWIVLEAFLKKASLTVGDVKGVCISSVVPDQNIHYIRMMNKYLDIEPLLIDHHLKLNLEIDISEPALLGADRICNAVAGKMKYTLPVIIVDLGTATTFDCIDINGNYIGGIICQGIESAAAILHHKAAKLPKIDLYFPQNVIGKNTEDSMRSGILFGSIEMINGLIRMVKKELGGNAKVIATGGLSQLIAEKTRVIDVVDRYLTLEGMNYIYHLNMKDSVHEK
jgi:type III pantothenate kinase